MTDKLKSYDAAHWTVMAVWSKNSKAADEIQDNAAARFPETDLKQVLWERGSGQERPKSLI